jgi:TfoX/Sxy family transcriptional regulator of competence genes
MSYYQAPEETLEDIEAMNVWANKAYNTALRAAARKTN